MSANNSNPLWRTFWFCASLPEKTVRLLLGSSPSIQKIESSDSVDINMRIDKIKEFLNAYVSPEKWRITEEIKSTEKRSEAIKENLGKWRAIDSNIPNDTNKFGNKISPIIDALKKEVEELESRVSNLHLTRKRIAIIEGKFGESIKILEQCLSTMPLLNIPVITEGAQLIKGDYLATLAANTISEAEAEMARIQNYRRIG